MIYMMFVGIILLTIGCSGIIFCDDEDKDESN